MKDKDPITTKTTQTIADILVRVLLRRFSGEKTENGEEKTGIPPHCMASHKHT